MLSLYDWVGGEHTHGDILKKPWLACIFLGWNIFFSWKFSAQTLSHKENEGEDKQIRYDLILWVNKIRFWIFAGKKKKKVLSASLNNEESKKLCSEGILENNEIKFEEYTVTVTAIMKLHHIQRVWRRVICCVECVCVLWVDGAVVSWCCTTRVQIYHIYCWIISTISTALTYASIDYLPLMPNSQEKPAGWFPRLPLNVGSG